MPFLLALGATWGGVGARDSNGLAHEHAAAPHNGSEALPRRASEGPNDGPLPEPTGSRVVQRAAYLNPVNARRDLSPFAASRLAHPTRLVRRTKPPQGLSDPISADARLVAYISERRTLKGWIARPFADALKGAAGYPAVVYLHAGFALSAEDLAAVEPLRNAGFLVFLPTLRAENGNPGDYEMFFGELDDVAAAVEYTQRFAEVDPSRVAVYGAASGGMLAALYSLLDAPGVLDTGSFAGIATEDAFDLMPIPFENTDLERDLRLFLPNAAHIQQPHWACTSVRDADRLRATEQARLRAAEPRLLQVSVVSGPLEEAPGKCLAQYVERLRVLAADASP